MVHPLAVVCCQFDRWFSSAYHQSNKCIRAKSFVPIFNYSNWEMTENVDCYLVSIPFMWVFVSAFHILLCLISMGHQSFHVFPNQINLIGKENFSRVKKFYFLGTDTVSRKEKNIYGNLVITFKRDGTYQMQTLICFEVLLNDLKCSTAFNRNIC